MAFSTPGEVRNTPTRFPHAAQWAVRKCASECERGSRAALGPVEAVEPQRPTPYVSHSRLQARRCGKWRTPSSEWGSRYSRSAVVDPAPAPNDLRATKDPSNFAPRPSRRQKAHWSALVVRDLLAVGGFYQRRGCREPRSCPRGPSRTWTHIAFIGGRGRRHDRRPLLSLPRPGSERPSL